MSLVGAFPSCELSMRRRDSSKTMFLSRESKHMMTWLSWKFRPQKLWNRPVYLEISLSDALSYQQHAEVWSALSATTSFLESFKGNLQYSRANKVKEDQRNCQWSLCCWSGRKQCEAFTRLVSRLAHFGTMVISWVNGGRFGVPDGTCLLMPRGHRHVDAHRASAAKENNKKTQSTKMKITGLRQE